MATRSELEKNRNGSGLELKQDWDCVGTGSKTGTEMDQNSNGIGIELGDYWVKNWNRILELEWLLYSLDCRKIQTVFPNSFHLMVSLTQRHLFVSFCFLFAHLKQGDLDQIKIPLTNELFSLQLGNI